MIIIHMRFNKIEQYLNDLLEFLNKIFKKYVMFKHVSIPEFKYMRTGFDDVYNLDTTLSPIISSLLKEFRKSELSYPHQLSSMEEWNQIIDQMIEAFEMVPNDFDLDEEGRKRMETGMKLFVEYYKHLWV